ncbi:MAG: hypothetical protein IJ364_04855 [Oscillospiraceae bacterium]|nr:hypothetical protein [Oscillospiraceae bacterium]
MIKDKDLREKSRIRYCDGESITLAAIQSSLSKLAAENGIKIAFCNEQVKSGTVFNRDAEECLVVYHPEHRNDYICTVIRVKHQGIHAFLCVDETGESKMAVKVYAATDGRKDARAERKGMTMSERVGHAIGSSISLGIAGIGANTKKFEEEQTWYVILEDIIAELFGE